MEPLGDELAFENVVQTSDFPVIYFAVIQMGRTSFFIARAGQ
jgi:hypothetical protein